MNMQDVVDFIDLVKNPDQYATYVNELKEEQARLTLCIETVGVVGEINNIRAAIDREADALEEKWKQKSDAIDATLEKKTKTLESKTNKAEQLIQQYEGLVQEAAGQMQGLVQQREEVTKQEKLIQSIQVDLAEKKEKLDALLREYEDKVAKLRAVMS